jgi:hypothetical protein
VLNVDVGGSLTLRTDGRAALAFNALRVGDDLTGTSRGTSSLRLVNADVSGGISFALPGAASTASLENVDAGGVMSLLQLEAASTVSVENATAAALTVVGVATQRLCNVSIGGRAVVSDAVMASLQLTYVRAGSSVAFQRCRFPAGITTMANVIIDGRRMGGFSTSPIFSFANVTFPSNSTMALHGFVIVAVSVTGARTTSLIGFDANCVLGSNVTHSFANVMLADAHAGPALTGIAYATGAVIGSGFRLSAVTRGNLGASIAVTTSHALGYGSAGRVLRLAATQSITVSLNGTGVRGYYTASSIEAPQVHASLTSVLFVTSVCVTAAAGRAANVTVGGIGSLAIAAPNVSVHIR